MAESMTTLDEQANADSLGSIPCVCGQRFAVSELAAHFSHCQALLRRATERLTEGTK